MTEAEYKEKQVQDTNQLGKAFDYGYQKGWEEGIDEALELAKEKGFSWCQSFGKQINIRNVHEYSEAFDKEMDTIAERLKEKEK